MIDWPVSYILIGTYRDPALPWTAWTVHVACTPAWSSPARRTPPPQASTIQYITHSQTTRQTCKQCFLKGEPASNKVSQNWNSIGSTSIVCWQWLYNCDVFQRTRHNCQHWASIGLASRTQKRQVYVTDTKHPANTRRWPDAGSTQCWANVGSEQQAVGQH